VRLFSGVLRELLDCEPDRKRQDADLAGLPQSYTDGGGCFSVLEAADGSIWGSVGLRRIDGGTCELRKMYLRRDHRGLGLGGC